MAHAGGRPTKYKPEYCEMLIKHMASGLSYDTFAAVVHVDDDTLYGWEKKNPEFYEAKKEGFKLNKLFWEKLGTAGAMGKIPNFNCTAWIFNMKNRHHWRDRQDITLEDTTQKMSDKDIEDAARKIIEERTAKASKDTNKA